MDIKFSHEKPLVFDRCEKKFGVEWESTIFTYGDTIYSKEPIADQKVAHEKVHIKQQAEYGPEVWWDRYFEEESFRLIQEMKAYKAEAKHIRDNIKNRNKRFAEIREIAKHLSSSLYGNVVGFDDAMAALIK